MRQKGDSQYFSKHGVTGSLDAIAKQAGVGAGTLYRHFPNREALLAELLTARDDALVSRRDDLRNGSANAADALAGWLEALTEWAGAFDGLSEPLRAATTTSPSPLAVTCQGFITTTDEFRSSMTCRSCTLAWKASTSSGGSSAKVLRWIRRAG